MLAPDAVIVVELFIQIVEDAALKLTVGAAPIVTVTVVVLEHPPLFVPVIVYVVEVVGDAVTVLPVEALRLDEGVQV